MPSRAPHPIRHVCLHVSRRFAHRTGGAKLGREADFAVPESGGHRLRSRGLLGNEDPLGNVTNCNPPPSLNRNICAVVRAVVSDLRGCAFILILPKMIAVYFL